MATRRNKWASDKCTAQTQAATTVAAAAAPPPTQRNAHFQGLRCRGGLSSRWLVRPLSTFKQTTCCACRRSLGFASLIVLIKYMICSATLAQETHDNNANDDDDFQLDEIKFLESSLARRVLLLSQGSNYVNVPQIDGVLPSVRLFSLLRCLFLRREQLH